MTYHRIIEKDKASLYLIDLPQRIDGFDHFLAAWLLQDRVRGRNLLFDCGPSSSIPSLVEDLEKLQTRPDHLLLTHVHLDHGGGTGDLLHYFPDMKVTAHTKGIRHLIDPLRLWQGSLSVLEKTAETYGEPSPVPENAFTKAPRDIKEIDTPGHASHHQAYYSELEETRILFSGEAAGVCLEDMSFAWMDGKTDDQILYVRPATAPPFRYDTTLSSIEKLHQIPCDLICPGHYGPVHSTEESLNKARVQLELWRKLLLPLFKSGERNTLELVNMLIERDPCLIYFNKFNQEVRSRERSFLKNSVQGFLNYFELETSKGE